MYNDNKYRHVCTSEISYITHFKNKEKINNKTSKNGPKQNQSDNRI